MRVFIVVTEDLFSRSWADDKISTVNGVFTNKTDAIELASKTAKDNKLILSGDLKWYDEDENAMTVYITEEETK